MRIVVLALFRFAAAIVRDWYLLLTLAVFGLILWIGYSYDPIWFAEKTYREEKLFETKIDNLKILQQLFLGTAATAAFALAIWRSWTAHQQAQAALRQAETSSRQADLAERGHNTERYATAASLLDSERISVRQAGIFSLANLAITSPKQSYILSLNLLLSFIQEQQATLPADTRADIVDAFDAIGSIRNLPSTELEKNEAKSLSISIRADSAYFKNKNYSGVTLSGCDFARSVFSNCLFLDTTFVSSNLEGVRFAFCDMALAQIYTDEIDRAEFYKCELSGVEFLSTDIRRIRFFECELGGTDLSHTNVTADQLKSCWCWSDSPPSLPDGVHFDNYFSEGENNSIRLEYYKSRREDASLGYGAPKKRS